MLVSMFRVTGFMLFINPDTSEVFLFYLFLNLMSQAFGKTVNKHIF